MPPIGEHYHNRDKLTSLGHGHPWPIVDVCWTLNAYQGFDPLTARVRLSEDANRIWDGGAGQPKPYLRIDYTPGLALADTAAYYDGVADVMMWWMGAPRARLTIICGNEPNLPYEGSVQPQSIAPVVAEVVRRRDLLWPSDPNRPRILAPAVAPWAPYNVSDPADFFPGPSTEWRNYQFGIARRLANTNLDGYCVHAYGRAVAGGYGAAEPLTNYWFGEWAYGPGQQAGSRVWRDFLAAVTAGDGRGLPLFVGEINCHVDQPSSFNYVGGWLQNLRADLASEPRVEGAAWFVSEPHGSWTEDSLKLRIGACANADDDFNQCLQTN